MCVCIISSHAQLTVSTHLIYNAFVVGDVLAKVDSRIPDVVLTVQAAAGLLQVLMLGDGNLVPGETHRRNEVGQTAKHARG